MKNQAKYSRLLVSLAVGMALTTACGGDAVDITGVTASADYLKVADKLNFGGNEQKASIAITSNCNWTVTRSTYNNEDATWLTVGTSSGDGNGTISLTTNTINPSALDERHCVLAVKTSDGITREVTVTQRVASEILTVPTEVDSIVAEAADGNLTATFTVTSNAQWTVTDIAYWISLTYTGEDGAITSDNTIRGTKEVTVTAQPNPSEKSRKCPLTITGYTSGEDYVKKVTITQRGRIVTLSMDPTSLPDRPAKGGEYTFNVVGNAQWGLSAPDAEWFSFTPKSGQGETKDSRIPVTIKLEDNTSSNPRSIIITATSESGKTATCEITQIGATPPVFVGASVVSGSVQRSQGSVKASFTSPLDITECGFCYSLTAKPTINNTKVTCTPSTTTPETANTVITIPETVLSGLESGRKYYVRAYATNANGTNYSDELTITTVGDTPGDGENPTPTL